MRTQKKLVLVGQVKIEIWAADHWQQQLSIGGSRALGHAKTGILVGYRYEPKPQFTANPDRRIFVGRCGPSKPYTRTIK